MNFEGDFDCCLTGVFFRVRFEDRNLNSIPGAGKLYLKWDASARCRYSGDDVDHATAFERELEALRAAVAFNNAHSQCDRKFTIEMVTRRVEVVEDLKY